MEGANRKAKGRVEVTDKVAGLGEVTGWAMARVVAMETGMGKATGKGRGRGLGKDLAKGMVLVAALAACGGR